MHVLALLLIVSAPVRGFGVHFQRPMFVQRPIVRPLFHVQAAPVDPCHFGGKPIPPGANLTKGPPNFALYPPAPASTYTVGRKPVPAGANLSYGPPNLTLYPPAPVDNYKFGSKPPPCGWRICPSAPCRTSWRGWVSHWLTPSAAGPARSRIRRRPAPPSPLLWPGSHSSSGRCSPRCSSRRECPRSWRWRRRQTWRGWTWRSGRTSASWRHRRRHPTGRRRSRR